MKKLVLLFSIIVLASGTCLAQTSVQFSSSFFVVGEGDQRVNLTVTRSGNTSGTSSVGFATNDAAGLTNCNVFNGVASPRCDYINTIGTMSFAAGETSKSFSVAIIDDSYAEGTENFTATLSNPSGATLGTQSTATVMIVDNETTTGPNPIDNANFFVRQQYLDFLGREPDSFGFPTWVSTINNCAPGDTSCDRIHVSQQFFQSAEFQERGYFVYRFYNVAFGRKPDYGEFVPDLASVSGFLDGTQLEAAKVAFIASFMARPAFANIYNGLTNQQDVDALLNTAGVTLFPSPARRQELIDGLNNLTLTRAAVLRQIVESTEVATKYNHQAYAVMEYFGYLRRQPDAFYLDWIAVLDQSNNPRGMVTGFVNSAEYGQRFSGSAGPSPTPTPAPQLTSITVSPSSASISIGQTQTVIAQAKDQNGAIMNRVSFTWASSNSSVASVTNGVAIGVAAGTAGITASSGGVTSNSATLSVTVTPPKASKVVIDKPSVFFPALSQSAQLTAQILDAQGATLPGTVTWTSTAPDKVSVDATGRLVANAIGSTQIVAESAGIRSAPTLVIVAQPAAGALLVADAQVVSVGPPLGLAAGEVPGVGTQYEVTLQGVAAPTSGTVVLAAETAPIAGKVISTRQDAGRLVVTLALAPLYELFRAYDINWTIDLSAFPVGAVPSQSPQATLSAEWNAARRDKLRGIAAARPLDELEPFKAFKCEASIEAQLVAKQLQLSLENQLTLVWDDRPGYSKHALEGSVALVVSAGLKLKAGFAAKGKCDAQAQIKLPVFGGWSALLMPAVRVGLGAGLDGEILLVQGELSVTGKVGFSGAVGWECGGASPDCRGLDAITPLKDLTTTSKIPSANDMQAKVSAQFYVLAGLDASILMGAANAEILEARIGPKQSFDLAFEEDQAARTDYASSYDLKLAGVIEPGSALKKAIELVFPDGGPGVSFKAEFSKDISESPKGTLSVSKSRVAIGAPIDFTVDLTPSTLNYWLLGYNVTGVELYRKRDDELKFTRWKSMSILASNSPQATYRWVPEGTDAGKYEFAAFVNTQVLTPLLEVGPNSIQKVEVSCFTAGGLTANGTWMAPQALTCADTWVGTSTTAGYTGGTSNDPDATQAQLTLKVDTGLDTGDPAIVGYYAEGTVKVKERTEPISQCTYKAAEATFGLAQVGRFGGGTANQFIIDYSTKPATFGGVGEVFITQTIECPNAAPRTERLLYSFFRSDTPGSLEGIPLSADGLTIQASRLPFWSFQLTRP